MTAVTGSTSGTRAPVLKAVPQRPVRSHEPTWSAILEFGQFLNDFLDRSDLCLADFFRGMRRTELAGHFVPPSKNIFPLPRFSSWPRDLECSQAVQEVHLLCANLLVATLNLLEQGMPKQPPCEFRTPKQCNSAQTSVRKHLAQRTELFLSNLDSALGQTFYWQGAFHQVEVHDRSRYEPVRGNDVDLPDRAGTCNPEFLVPPELWRLVADPALVFPSEHDARLEDDLCGQHRAEYLKLTARELRCGKLRLRPSVQAQARVFAAPKQTEHRQRKIWDGAFLSAAAADPPPPHRLANPSSFLDIVVNPGEELFLSKRDASTYFDTLLVPGPLQPWFGQAPLTVQELISLGFSLANVTALTDGLENRSLLPDCLLFPVNVVWPMGFSWSPCVAQACSVGCVIKAGVKESQILSLDHEMPQQQDELCAVCMDDLLFFHKSASRGKRTLQRIDAVFQQHGIKKNASKDVSLTPSMTGLGCDLTSSPPLVQPARGKLANTVLALCDVLQQGRASPRALNSLLGVLQWFCLMQRSMFSVFDEVYAFVRRAEPDVVHGLPSSVSGELLTILALSPLFPAHLDRPFLDELLACDAAPEFGFGVSAARCGASTVQRVGRLAERRGDYVRLVPDPATPEVPRVGNERRLPISKCSFRTLISCQAKRQAHSGLLECHGVLLALKWVSRSAKRHHHRAVVLVDAKVAIGRMSKGRSSARALRRVLRSTAALTLACDLLPRLVYIPSESNPADAPSRGHSVAKRAKRRTPGARQQ